MLSHMRRQISAAFPPKPSFTEANLDDLTGKVYIVTGANTGLGKELARILYSRNANVYAMARSEEKSLDAIADIKKSHPSSGGEVSFIKLDLADLSTIKATADEFLRREKQLHVLFNNAGVMTPPKGSKTAQGFEMQLGVNNVGTQLLTKLLTPTLVSTAAALSPEERAAGAIRVVWVASSAAELLSPRGGGVELHNLDYHEPRMPPTEYGVSKAGNYLQSCELARRLKADGVVSVALNPGNLYTELFRHRDMFTRALLKHTVQHPPVMGAYTELFAGLSPEVTLEKSGSWIQPWGRFESIRDDVLAASKHESEGGTGIGLKFWEWAEEQIKPFA